IDRLTRTTGFSGALSSRSILPPIFWISAISASWLAPPSWAVANSMNLMDCLPFYLLMGRSFRAGRLRLRHRRRGHSPHHTGVVRTEGERAVAPGKRWQSGRRATTITMASPTDSTARRSLMERRRVGILVFENVEVLDFCGPFEVFSVTR